MLSSALVTVADVCRPFECGRRDRSCSPTSPSAIHRPIVSYTVGRLTENRLASSVGECPASQREIKRLRSSTVPRLHGIRPPPAARCKGCLRRSVNYLAVLNSAAKRRVRGLPPSSRHLDLIENAAQQILQRQALHLGLGTQRHAMREDRRNERFHIVGRDEVASR